MRILFLHSDYIKVYITKKAIEEAEEISEKEIKVEDCLVCFISIEKYDNLDTLQKSIDNIIDISKKVKTNRIVLYPYVHLTSFPKNPKESLEILKLAEIKLKEKGYEVYRLPFGWYKSFEIKVKGHPLSELSRQIYKNIDISEYLTDILKFLEAWYTIQKEDNEMIIRIREEKKKEIEEKKAKKRFLIVYPDGKEYLITKDLDDSLEVIEWSKVISNLQNINEVCLKDFDGNLKINKKDFSEDFRILIEKEALGKEYTEFTENPIRNALEKFGFEWESYSDYGHMRYKPYAALMIDLVADYAIELSRNLDIPVYIIKGTNMFDLREGPVSKHAKLFGERMYEIETDKSKFVLRYAACFQQFSIAKDIILSQKNLPFGMLEIADSYRFEKPGELVLGFRLRKFTMPDLHIFCKNIEEAKSMFFYIHKKIMEEIKKTNNDYELLINFGSPEFYENYKWLIKEIIIDVNKPVLVCIYPPAEERYWIVNIEYNIIDILKRVREIGTTQIDIGNGKRFEIKYVDDKNNENYVIILHNAILGSIERYIYAVFNGALKKKKPELPLWLSPVQVRILPISEKYLEYVKEIAKILEENNIRVEIDDRDLTLGKKILDAEKLWIPYIVVIGEKEYNNKTINVRKRNGEIKEMKIEEIIREIKEKTKGYPYRPLYSTIYLSKKPNNL